MSGGTHHPIPEFRDADHFWGPGLNQVVNGSHEIIRPKPRRPGDLNRLSVDGSLLLAKSAGYTSVFHHQQQQQQQQSSPAFVHPPQHSMSPSSSSSALQQSSPHHGGQLLLQSHHQSHPALVQSMMTCAAVVGKSPSRDLGGGSTPVLKTTTAAHHTPATAQAAFRHTASVRASECSGVGGSGSSSGNGGSSITSMAVGRSASMMQSHQQQQMLGANSRDLRDAWDYYGAPPPQQQQQQMNSNCAATTPPYSTTSIISSPVKMINSGAAPGGQCYVSRPAVAPGASAAAVNNNATSSSAGRQTQPSPALVSMQQRNNAVGPGNYRDPRFSSLLSSSPSSASSTLSPSSCSPKMENMAANGACSPLHQQQQHAPSPHHRLFSPVASAASPSSVQLQLQLQQQQQQQQQQQHHQQQIRSQHQQQSAVQLHHSPHQQQQLPAGQQQQQQIHQLQYPYYNAKLESLTHRMPNLSFEGLGQSAAASVNNTTTTAAVAAVNRALALATTSPSSCVSPLLPATCSNSSPSSTCSSSSSSSSNSNSLPENKAAENSTQQQRFLSSGHSSSSSSTTSGESVNVTTTAAAAAVAAAATTNQLEQKQKQPSFQSSGDELLAAGTVRTSPVGEEDDPPSAGSGGSELKSTVADGNKDEPEARASPSAIAKTIASNNKTKTKRTDSSTLLGGGSSGSNNNKELVKAEASCLLRMADPSMMLVQSAEQEQEQAEEDEEGEEGEEEEVEEAAGSESTKTSPSSRQKATEFVTDCGSLSKSSSDGDPSSVGVVSRKRPPTKLKSRRRNILSFPHHISVDELRLIQRRKESMYAGSSSDENRSSGHASMSDGHTSSSPPAETLPRHTHYRTCLNAVPEDDKLSSNCATPQQSHPPKTNNNRRVVAAKAVSRHRGLAGVKDDLSSQLEHATGLEDIKMAIEQLTLRSHGSRTSYSTSTYSSLSGSEGGGVGGNGGAGCGVGGTEPMRRLIRHSSLETINTNVTVADEFVWVDSYNRLVELQQLPWSNHDILRVIQNGRIKEHLERVSMETVPRLSYLLQRALVRVARETQRLARPLAMCSKQEVCSALRIVLSPALADSCIKACLRAAAMFTVSGDNLRQSKSARAALQLSVGRFHRWMCDVRLGKFIHDYAAVYLTAGLENLLEEIMMQCMPPDQDTLLTASVLENAIANNGDLWGLLQPYAHLNAGRTATGTLSLPRWPSQSGLDSSGLRGSGSSVASSGGPDDHCRNTSKTLEQSLLTTCVGTINELHEILQRVTQFHFRHSAPCPGATPNAASKQALTWASSSLHALFYFMRCSQLEHAEHSTQRAPIQELVYERPYIVLPPLIEWVRVASAHAEHRHSSVLDKDDVAQAARLLLPGVDCPIRAYGFEEILCPRRHMDDLECSRKLKIDLAFKMLSSARSDLIPHALQLLPSTKINTVSEHGLTPLMLAAIRGDETLAKVLLDAGADVDAETPTIAGAQNHPGAYPNPETQHWTALTYSAIQGQLGIAKMLLDRGANVEGGARLSEDKCTETPLQVAAGTGNLEMISLLLSHGARPFLSTLVRDTLCYSSSAQKGCYSAMAVASAHGQRSVLHKLLSHPVNSGNSNAEILSLEEILAEGASQPTSDRRPAARSNATGSNSSSDSSRSSVLDKMQGVKLNKSQIKTLQEAMYHSAENAHLDITLDLRNLGVPWTLHCWMHTLATAHEHSLENVIDQLLQDFLQVWGPDDYSTQFVDECLPIIFNIFRYSKNEGTTLLLADIFATCYGRESIKEIRDTSLCGGPRIDPKFVNNPELSDVQFRVEGRVFYAHKIILITASPRFKSMLNSKFCEGNPPIIQINDIRYDIFQMVMHYLYKGGCENLDVNQNDVLELMAAANFFQLDGLLRFCESRCSILVDLDNIVSMYIHAKVYNAVLLLEFCQGFLLQNMVALLTYDDSVRRLIFGKKLHNHDVLAGLLLTLQSRIKGRSQHKLNK